MLTEEATLKDPMRYETRLLTEFAEIESYRELASAALDLDYPADYFHSAQVYGVFADGILVGGGLWTSAAPYRTLNSIPPEAAVVLPFGVRSSLGEINAVCVDAEHRNSALLVALFQKMIFDLHGAGVRYGIFSVERNSHLLSTYRRTGSRPLYEGLTLLQPGMKTACEENIEYFDLQALVPLLANRYRRARHERANHRGYNEAAEFTRRIRRSV